MTTNAAASDSAPLFQPIRLGELTLPNRIVMSPLTRNRATPDTEAPTSLTAEYYVQRATAGLIISEGVQVSRQSRGYVQTPGIYTDTQVTAWRKVTDAVHQARGRMFCQLWHVGRVSHTALQPDNAAPVGPSNIPANSKTFFDGKYMPVSKPRALGLEEIPGIINEFRTAAVNAKAAGFDGIEFHGANGYLLDQFLVTGANNRTDAYGGPIQHRARLMLECVEAALGVWDRSRVGIRLSPVNASHDLHDDDPQATYGYVVEKLSALGIAYIHVVEGVTVIELGYCDNPPPFDYLALRRSFNGAYIANNRYDLELGNQAISSNRADLISFGRPYIANPDLVERLRRGAPLNEVDRATVYGGGAHGYTDYPTLCGPAQ